MLSTMKNIVFAVIVTEFLMKSYKKLREKQPDTEEEVYRLMRAAYERRAAARKTFARMDVISTPRDGGMLSSIDTLQQMAPERFA